MGIAALTDRQELLARNKTLVVIEGVDGSGKSTVARKLARVSGAKLVRTPPEAFDPLRPLMDQRASVETRCLFYLCSVALASDMMAKLLLTRNIVCDRYIASTLAYHRAMGLQLNWRWEDLPILKPDYTFFLKVSDERERLRRLRERGRLSSADRAFVERPLDGKLRREYRRFRMIAVETSGRSVDDIVEDLRARARL